MNILSIEIVQHKDNQTKYNEIQIFIDGLSLIERLKAFELPFAQREGSLSLAGSYGWLVCDIKLKAILLGQTTKKSILLDCECGAPGCWPFLAKISVDDQLIIWSDFEQPHRSERSSAGKWDYRGFGPFKFERNQYEIELEKIV